MSITESAWQRARGDTASVFRTIRFWLFEVGIGAALTIFVLLWTPPPWMPPLAEDWVRTVYQVLVPLGGVLAGLLGVLLASLFSAPYRQRNDARKMVVARDQEINRLTERRLSVSLPEPRYDYLGDQWIRLRVENPTAIPIRECYGRLVGYRLASVEFRKDGELLEDIQVSPERGIQTTRQSGELPPQRHMFPWSPIQMPETTITIPGHNSCEFLYVAVKRSTEGCFYTPTDMGLMYPNYGLGSFELELEIGSEVEPFQPTRVRLVFRSGGDLEAKMFELLPD